MSPPVPLLRKVWRSHWCGLGNEVEHKYHCVKQLFENVWEYCIGFLAYLHRYYKQFGIVEFRKSDLGSELSMLLCFDTVGVVPAIHMLKFYTGDLEIYS